MGIFSNDGLSASTSGFLCVIPVGGLSVLHTLCWSFNELGCKECMWTASVGTDACGKQLQNSNAVLTVSVVGGETTSVLWGVEPLDFFAVALVENVKRD